jgi:3-mercaptopyruvate sulfurtransferase SseA
MRFLLTLSAALALLTALLTGCNSAENQNNGPTSNANTPANQKTAEQSTRGDGAKRITIDEVRAELDKNKDNIIIVDVRDKNSYETNHIKSAINIPVNDVAQRAKELPRDKMIITYCA